MSRWHATWSPTCGVLSDRRFRGAGGRGPWGCRPAPRKAINAWGEDNGESVISCLSGREAAQTTANLAESGKYARKKNENLGKFN